MENSNPSNLDNPTDKCSSCEQQIVKKFKLFHKATSNGDTTKKRRKYTDETGRLWHGTKCPSCAANWRKERAQKEIELTQQALKLQLEEKS